MFQKGFEGIDLAIPIHLTVRDLVKEYTERSFPEWKQIRQIGYNGLLEACPGEDLLDIAIVRVLADDRLCPGVIYHILDLKGGIDRGDGNNNGTNLLRTQKGDDPLNAVGDIDYDTIAFLDTYVQQGTGEPLTSRRLGSYGTASREPDDLTA